jgi:hypothetical protein
MLIRAFVVKGCIKGIIAKVRQFPNCFCEGFRVDKEDDFCAKRSVYSGPYLAKMLSAHPLLYSVKTTDFSLYQK